MTTALHYLFVLFKVICPRPTASTVFSRNMIEISHGQTNEIHHPSSLQHLETILLNGLMAGGIGRREGRLVTFQSSEIVFGKRTEDGKIFHHTFFLSCFLLRKRSSIVYCTSPSDTVKRFCTKETSEVAPHAPAFQADVRASGGRLLDPDQRGSVSSAIVLIALYKHLTRKSLKKICFSVKEKMRK